MSAPLRFLGLAIIAYVGLRTAGSALALEPIGPAVAPPAIAPPMEPQAAAPDPVAFAEPPAMPPGYAAFAPYGPAGAMAMPAQAHGMMPYPLMPALMPPQRAMQPLYYPVPYPMPPQSVPAAAAAMAPIAPPADADFVPAAAGYEGEAPPLEQWPAIGTAGPFTLGGVQRTPSWGGKAEDPLDMLATVAGQSRWSADAWALVRPPAPGVYRLDDPARGLNPGLASNGALGGSQAGLRLTWRPTGRLGVHLRASTALMPQGRSGQAMAGGEGSLGVSWQPLGKVPVRLLAERRQRLGPALGGGRNAFALLAEGGVYDQPLPYGFRLDGYGQAGMVGLSSRDYFADGALAATYPFMPRLAVGGGVWGGTQPGLYRLDAGPRLSYQLSPRLRVHVDYRFRMTGNADPVSGPALTLAGGF